MTLQIPYNIASLKACFFPYRHKEAEPRRLTPGRGFGKNKAVIQRVKSFEKSAEIPAACRNELRELVELCTTHSRLHIGGFQVETKVGKRVFVIVPERQFA